MYAYNICIVLTSYSVIDLITVVSMCQLSILVHPDKNLEDIERAQKAFDGMPSCSVNLTFTVFYGCLHNNNDNNNNNNNQECY